MHVSMHFSVDCIMHVHPANTRVEDATERLQQQEFITYFSFSLFRIRKVLSGESPCVRWRGSLWPPFTEAHASVEIHTMEPIKVRTSS